MRRALLTFWALVVVAVLAVASVSAGLSAPPGPLTGVRVAVSGMVLVASLALAARVMIAVERVRRQARQNTD